MKMITSGRQRRAGLAEVKQALRRDWRAFRQRCRELDNLFGQVLHHHVHCQKNARFSDALCNSPERLAALQTFFFPKEGRKGRRSIDRL